MKNVFLVTILIQTIILSAQTRPQLPAEPYKYLNEDVVFDNMTDGVKLAGTITYPKKGTNFPAVVLISGSGPQDRNSELFGHQSFKVIADYLTKKGIAVLRVDDRGTGESEGVYNETSLQGFKRDTEFAIDYLKTRKNINPNKIGLIGHSLGGVIAPMIASERTDIGFIIMLAGTGLRGDKLMVLQKEVIERKMGLPDQAVEAGKKNMGGAYDIIMQTELSSDTIEARLKSHFTAVFGAALPQEQIDLLANQLVMPWLMDFIRFDPTESLQKVKCPVLALNGSNDLQVPAKENLNAIQKTLEKGGNADVTIMQLPDLNHLFQTSDSGLPTEYASIEETFSPKALKIMAKWIKKRVK